MNKKERLKELSNKLHLSDDKVKKILDEISKPSLTNIDCSFDGKLGVGPSDKTT